MSATLGMRFQPVVDHVLSVTADAPAVFEDRGRCGRIHTAFNTLFLDTVMGSCVLGELEAPCTIATIKLTTQHQDRLIVGETVICRARFEGISDQVAHVTGEIVGGNTRRHIASAVGTFMVGTVSKRRGA